MSPAWTMWSTFAKTSATRGCTKPCVSAMTPMRSLKAQLLQRDGEVALVERAAFDEQRPRRLASAQLPRLRDDRPEQTSRASRAPDEAPLHAVHRDRQLRQLVRNCD